eukprot:Amastigsp_a222161_2.p3 type:complete len:100 gc:universal Amastigsp_a222161_2:102-401(+)
MYCCRTTSRCRGFVANAKTIPISRGTNVVFPSAVVIWPRSVSTTQVTNRAGRVGSSRSPAFPKSAHTNHGGHSSATVVHVRGTSARTRVLSFGTAAMRT